MTGNDNHLIKQGYRSMDCMIKYMFDAFPEARNAISIYDCIYVSTRTLSGTLALGPNSTLDDFRRLLVASIRDGEALTGKRVSER